MVDLFQYRNWAISEQIFRDVAPRIEQALRAGHSIDAIFPKHTLQQILPRIQSLLNLPEEQYATAGTITIDMESALPVINQENKNIAIIPVIGGLTKYTGFCGEAGMQDYQNMIGRANASSKVHGIVLLMDSPGGTVDGTPEFGMTVRDSKKPIGVFGDRMVASAALWVASQAKVIVGNKNNPTEFGSIGTLMMMENYQNVIEAGRLPKMEIIRAPQSVDKAKLNYLEEMPDDVRSELMTDLRGITETFISTVKSGRGAKLNTKLEGLFTGKMFDVYTANQHGLIDATGTLQTAVNKVAELARQQAKEEGTNQQTNKSANTMKFPKLNALLVSIFGGQKESKEVTLKVNSEGLQSEDTASLEAAEGKAAEMEAETARLTADNEDKGKKIATLEASVSEHKAQITSLETEKATLTVANADLKAKLDAKPAGSTTTVIPTDEPKGESKHRSQADDESDAYVAASAPMNFSKPQTQTQK